MDTDFPREFYDNATLQRIAQVIRVSPGRVVDGVDFTLGAAVAGFPYLQDLALPVNTPDPVGPYRVQARVRDDGGVASTELIYRVDAGPFQTLPLGRGSGDLFFVDIPGQPQGSVVGISATGLGMERATRRLSLRRGFPCCGSRC